MARETGVKVKSRQRKLSVVNDQIIEPAIRQYYHEYGRLIVEGFRKIVENWDDSAKPDFKYEVRLTPQHRFYLYVWPVGDTKQLARWNMVDKGAARGYTISVKGGTYLELPMGAKNLAKAVIKQKGAQRLKVSPYIPKTGPGVRIGGAGRHVTGSPAGQGVSFPKQVTAGAVPARRFSEAAQSLAEGHPMPGATSIWGTSESFYRYGKLGYDTGFQRARRAK